MTSDRPQPPALPDTHAATRVTRGRPPTYSQSGRNRNPAASTEIDSGCGTIHFQCLGCDRPIEVGQEWAGQKFECSSCGKIGTVPNGHYDQLPFYQKQGFFWLMYFTITPVALAILLFGDVYYERNGKVKSFGLANKIIAGVIAVVILFRIFIAFTK